MIIYINSLEDFSKILNNNEAVLVYFNTQSCNVGEALEPKVMNLITHKFPEIKVYKVDLNFSPEICAFYNAFVEPTILVFFDGKETIRKSRNIGVLELEQAIERPYNLFFN